MVDLHCPVICFTEQSKILIAKRADDREYYPGKWEFGCAKPNGTEPMWKTIRREYENDFGIPVYLSSDVIYYNRMDRLPMHWGNCKYASISSIDGMKDDCTVIGSPTVISSYEMKKSDGTIAIGIIFEGNILDIDVDRIKLTKKHSEYKFVTLKEAFEMTKDEVVPTFHLALSWYSTDKDE